MDRRSGRVDEPFPCSAEQIASVEVRRPNAARMYDYYLGGQTNFDVDRRAAEDGLSVLPQARVYARANRAFLARAVRYLVGQGVDQFLDLGSGIPTVGNVHEVAHRLNPDAKVAYVDFEPVAVAHARTLLAAHRDVSITAADIREPASVLTAPEVAGTLDFTRPVAVLAVAVIPFLTDDAEAAAVLSAYRDACPLRSFLVLSHISPVSVTAEQLANACEVMARTPTPVKWREVAEISPLLAGYELVDPGLVLTPHWHPELGPPMADSSAGDSQAEASNAYAAVGQLRQHCAGAEPAVP